jgi:D-3-phosphoglycerate dehydrogenase
MHVHRNVPGLLRRLNDVFGRRDLNIAAQYLQTDGDLGYVVVDAEGPADDASVLQEMRSINGTVRARLLY